VHVRVCGFTLWSSDVLGIFGCVLAYVFGKFLVCFAELCLFITVVYMFLVYYMYVVFNMCSMCLFNIGLQMSWPKSEVEDDLAAHQVISSLYWMSYSKKLSSHH
jgi:hypothetical protein